MYYESIAKALSQQNLVYFGKDLPELFTNIIPSSFAMPQHLQAFQSHFTADKTSSPAASP